MKKPDLSQFKPEQLKAASMLCEIDENGRRKYTQKKVAEELGVHRNTILYWLKKPEFVELMEYYNDLYMKSFMNVAYDALRKRINQGNVRAIELYMKFAGKLTERVEMEQSIEDKRDTRSLEEYLDKLKSRVNGGKDGE